MNERCYAAELGQCSTKISGEHFISKTILLWFDGRGGGIEVTGLPWPPRSLRAQSLQSNILCTNHNRSLSPLDTEMKRFFEAIASAHTLLRAGREALRFTFDGRLLERWLLKLLCGAVASNQIAELATGRIIRDWKPPSSWLEVLFGERRPPDGSGAYMANSTGLVAVTQPPALGFRPLFVAPRTRNDLVGVHVSLLGIELQLLLSTPGPPGHLYHPDYVRFHRGGGNVQLLIEWHDGNLLFQRKGLEIRYDPPSSTTTW